MSYSQAKAECESDGQSLPNIANPKDKDAMLSIYEGEKKIQSE